jgi:hypothetical protein
MGPERLLFPTINADNLFKLPRDAGIVPVRLLNAKFKIVRELVRFSIKLMEPKRLLFQSLSTDKFFKFSKDVGIVPIRLLEDKFKLVRDTKFPTFGGMLQEMLLKDKSRMLRLERLPICEGT